MISMLTDPLSLALELSNKKIFHKFTLTHLFQIFMDEISHCPIIEMFSEQYFFLFSTQKHRMWVPVLIGRASLWCF